MRSRSPRARQWVVWLVVATAGIVADQASKAGARAVLPIGQLRRAAGPLFLRRVENPDIAVSALPAGNVIPVVIGVLIVALLATFVVWARLHPIFVPGCALATAGCVGNLLDRLLHGRVTDFFVLGGLPTFNVADALIVLGFVLMLDASVLADLSERGRQRQVEPPGSAREHAVSPSFE